MVSTEAKGRGFRAPAFILPLAVPFPPSLALPSENTQF
jgi:hypothetical protein